MFMAIQRVYCSGPLQPGGSTSGQRPGPCFLETWTATPSLRNDREVMDVVTGQLATLLGDECTTAVPRLNASGATGPTGPPPPPPPPLSIGASGGVTKARTSD